MDITTALTSAVDSGTASPRSDDQVLSPRRVIRYENKGAASSEVNFLGQGPREIALHIAFRKQSGEVVLNEFLDGSWGNESSATPDELDGTYFLDVNNGVPEIWREDGFRLTLGRELGRSLADERVQVNGDATFEVLEPEDVPFQATAAADDVEADAEGAEAVGADGEAADEEFGPPQPEQAPAVERFIISYKDEGTEVSELDFLAESSKDILLHVEFHRKTGEIVLNDRVQGDWGDERSANTDELEGDYFLELKDGVPEIWRNDGFRLSLDRELPETITTDRVRLKGDVEVERLDPEDLAAEATAPPAKRFPPLSVSFHFTGAETSEVNFQGEETGEILLHLAFRHQKREIVLNDRVGGLWGNERSTLLKTLDGDYVLEVNEGVPEIRREDGFRLSLDRELSGELSLTRMQVHGDVRVELLEPEEVLDEAVLEPRFPDPDADDPPLAVTYRRGSAHHSGADYFGDGTNDIVLHLAIRRDTGQVALNDFLDGRWGAEVAGRPSKLEGTYVLEVVDGVAEVWRQDGFSVRLDRKVREPVSHKRMRPSGDAEVRVLDAEGVAMYGAMVEEGYADVAWLLNFDDRQYCELNPEVEEARLGPGAALRHFLSEGVPEARQYSIHEIFDPDFYRGYYAELSDLTEAEAYRHWITTGRNEGRRSGEAPFVRSLGLSYFPSSFSRLDYVSERLDYAQALPSIWHAFEHWVRDGALKLGREYQADLFTDKAEGASLLEEIGNHFAGRDDITAIRLYEKSLAYHDELAVTWQHLGDALLRSQLFGHAVTAYLKAKSLDPGNEFTYQNLYQSLRQLGQYDAALEHAQFFRSALPGAEASRAVLKEIREILFRRARDKAISRAVFDERSAALEIMLAYEDPIVAMAEAEEPLPPRTPAPGEKPRILIMGTPHLQQCLEYRVRQKMEHLEAAGFDVHFVSQDEPDQFMQRAHHYDVAIFYRVPAFPGIVEAICYARSLGMATLYEIDDLIFDSDIFPEPIETYGNQVSPRDYANLVVDAPLFRTAMELCDYGIASTPALQTRIAEHVRRRHCFLHRNAFGKRHEQFALIYNPHKVSRDKDPEIVTVFYGTATKAHNEDFELLAAPAILRLLQNYPNTRLVIAGYLTLPEEFDEVSSQIVRLSPVWDLDIYWSFVAGVDINIAVLKDSVISDCKSEIKWLEAAMLGVPSVVSPTDTYVGVLEDGHTALFAADPEEWYEQLERLVTDGGFRRAIGRAAYDHAVAHYSVRAMARNIEDIVSNAREEREPRLYPSVRRPVITLSNVFFPPQVIGGATRVVRDNFDYFLDHYSDEYEFQVFCAVEGGSRPYQVRSYEYRGARVTAVSHPVRDKMDLAPYDPRMGEIFSEYLEIQRPELVHFHCIQRLTASLLETARKHSIPYLVTVHDAWWISDYQFLVDEAGKVRDPSAASIMEAVLSGDKNAMSGVVRSAKLRAELSGAERVLAVSEPFAEIYRRAGVGNVLAVSNGVSALHPRPKVPADGRVRLGLLGGTQAHKGMPLVRAALMGSAFDNLHLTVVDHGLPPNHMMPETRWGTTPVQFVGKVPQDSVTELYARLDVLLAPSIWPESYGLVAREALVCGLWVLASNRGAIGSDVVHGENGFVVDVTDTRGLVAALREIDADPARFTAPPPLQPALRTADDQARDLIAIYREIVTGRPAEAVSSAAAMADSLMVGLEKVR